MKGYLPLVLAAAAPLAFAQDNNSAASSGESSAAPSATTTAESSAAESGASSTTTAASSGASDASSSAPSSTSSGSSEPQPSIAISDQSDPSPKRGLCYVNPTVQSDNNFWSAPGSDLTWYYNYQASPTSFYQDSQMEFVPMIWGAPGNPESDMTFYNTVANLIDAGQNITAILGFNEPDGCDGGGACVDAGVAATVWKKQVEPLKKKYPQIRLGAPAVTGSPRGITWLANWQENCAGLSANSTPCEMDFMPIHWYGDFAGLASHLGQINGTYKNNVSSIWVTEYALNDQPLEPTQKFYNMSAQYFDRLDYIERYSYFGAFRSDVSNVGPNAPFLTQNGKLTDIGSWYLGGVATGNIPSRAAGSGGSGTVHIGGTYSGKPYSSASRFGASTGWTLCIAAMLALVMTV